MFSGVLGRIVAKLIQYYTFFIPTLVIVVVESVFSLKIWQAVQRAPLSIVERDETEEHLYAIEVEIEQVRREERSTMVAQVLLIFYLAIASFVGIGMKGGFLDFTVPFFVVTLFFPAAYLVTRMINTVLLNATRFVFRDANGKPFILRRWREGRSRWPRLSAAAVSMIISFVALAPQWRLAVAAVYASILAFLLDFTFTLKVLNVEEKLRFFLATGLMTVISLTIFTALRIIVNGKLGRGVLPISTIDSADWTILLMSAVGSIVPYSILSACYRFDYVLAHENDVESTASNSGPTQTRIDLRGILVTGPTSSDVLFPMYFGSALAGWLLSYAFLAFLAVEGFVNEYNIPDETSAFYAMFIAATLMPLSITICALLRSEMRRVWDYRENWKREPTEDTGVESIIRETLPLSSVSTDCG